MRKESIMSRLKKTLVALAAATVVALALLPGLYGQGYQGIVVLPNAKPVTSPIIVAANTEPALYVKYFGPGGAATTTLAVETDGNLTFVVNGAAYAGFECPVSGALGGVIDVSDTACDTAGEVVDVINSTATSFSTGYFRAVIAAGLRADTIDNAYNTLSASTNVLRPEGQTVLWKSATLDDSQFYLADNNRGIANWVANNKLVPNPFADTDTVLLYAAEQITNAGTIGNVEVHCTVEAYKDGSKSTETDRVAFVKAAAATTVLGKVDEFLNNGGLRCNGGKLWVRVLASGADTSVFFIYGTGYQIPHI
jgi:hypothetical protein